MGIRVVAGIPDPKGGTWGTQFWVMGLNGTYATRRKEVLFRELEANQAYLESASKLS
jgi:hypothetical protein